MASKYYLRKRTQVNLLKNNVNAIHAIKVVTISTYACTLSSSCNREKQQMLNNLQKDVISTQIQPGCKKGAALLKNGQCEKSCEIEGGQEMALMV